MPSMVITPSPDGGLMGVSEGDQRHYARFKRRLGELQPGDTLAFSYRPPRSPVFHRRHFAVLGEIFHNQEIFAGDYEFRKWAEMGAGHVAWVPGPSGVPQAIPKSIDYESLDDDEFRELHTAVMDFIRSARGLSTLWPHAKAMDAWLAVDHIIESRKFGGPAT